MIISYSVHKGQNPLQKKSEKACMCFKTRRASARNYTVIDIDLNVQNLIGEFWVEWWYLCGCYRGWTILENKGVQKDS